ncbi:DUF6807 domain-containing protein [Parabacteroides pacaensis]|uniref:DUF6807 domain-containing protein n=1 Tax=Parabacteroides pacaensis TaxID=2086575 RepID=UPI000D1017AA|nr:PmoA family protein [Parabacteroides pacaensis]
MKYIWICFFSLLTLSVWAGEKKKVIVDAGNYPRKDCVVSVRLPDIGMGKSPNLSLFEKKGKKKKPVACQVICEKDGSLVLYWILDGSTPAGTSREYILQEVKKVSKGDVMKVEDTGRALIIRKDKKDVLQYNYAVTYPPAGVDLSYQRSGFIHPAYSPKGNVLTTIQPKDHYHHYGIWNPWTKIEYDGHLYDLWNLRDKKGTVRAKDVKNIYEGNVCAGYEAGLDHYIFTPDGEKVIMNEIWKVKTWNVPGGFLWDFESNLLPSTSLPVLLKAYRYAGFGWRATQEWTKENCEMFTSEGKTRQQIDGSTARWIYVTGQCGQKGRSGLLFLGHPDNYNFPEPLRIWDENANGGRGDAFVNFAPTKNKDWKLEPGKKYVLRYRVFSYDGEMTRERADRLWNEFAYPPKVRVIK